MFKKFGVVIIFVILSVSAIWYYSNVTKNNDQSKKVPPSSIPQVSPLAIVPTIAPTASPSAVFTTDVVSLINRKEKLECTWNIPIEGTQKAFSLATVWTANNQGRITITPSQQPETGIVANAIFKDEKVYSWITTKEKTLGFAFSQKENPELESKMSDSQKLQVKLIQKEFTFFCNPWQADTSKFIIPSNIDFEEVVK